MLSEAFQVSLGTVRLGVAERVSACSGVGRWEERKSRQRYWWTVWISEFMHTIHSSQSWPRGSRGCGRLRAFSNGLTASSLKRTSQFASRRSCDCYHCLSRYLYRGREIDFYFPHYLHRSRPVPVHGHFLKNGDEPWPKRGSLSARRQSHYSLEDISLLFSLPSDCESR